jgi:hypothetical protein
MPHDIKKLEVEVRTLQAVISKLGKAKHAEHMMTIIHRPGWTTQREDELVRAHTRSLHNQAAHLHRALDALIAIAQKIGK